MIEKGMENPETEPKKAKKAIDGNEKKKIVKLIQSSVLPGKLRTESHTLLVEAEPKRLQAEDAPSAPREPEIANAVEEVAEPVSYDFTGMTKMQLVEMLEETVQEPEVQKIKEKIAAIRVCFMELNKVDIDKEMEQFVQDGGVKESFQHAEDELEIRFAKAFDVFKANKARQNEILDSQKQENLASKQALLEELKELINSEDPLKKIYDSFRVLQDKWKEIGQVPATESANLWSSYHFLVEKFFDKVKISRELRDLDMKKNLDSKVELCEKAEELLNEKSLGKAFKELQKLHDEWKEIGPVPQEKKDEIWERFKAATDKINQVRREHYASLQEDQNANMETKTALCEKVEELVNGTYSKMSEWQKKADELNEIFKVWKTVGLAPKKQNEELWTRFKTAMDGFYARKKEFFSTLKDQQTENLERKTQLCVEAEALLDSNEWKKTSEQFKKLQEEWKTIGPVPKSRSEKIWKRFRAACDAFFSRKSDHFSNMVNEESANLEAKQAIIEKIKTFEPSGNRSEDIDAIKALQKEWLGIGFVPVKVKDSINTEYRKSLDELFDKIRAKNNDISTGEYKEMVEGLKDDPESSDRMRRERVNLSSRIQHLREEISVLENNIGFFSNSKQSELIKAEYEKKINKAKNDLQVLESKLKILNE